MGSIELQPVSEALAALFLPDLFEVDHRPVAAEKSSKTRSKTSKPAGGRRSGQKPLLSAKDFILPELIGRGDNGDPFVSVGSSSDDAQLAQVFRLAERGEESLSSFSDLPRADQALEKRRYFDHLKRVPKKEIERAIRRADLETWKQGGPQAESNFLDWWQRKQARKRTALRTKANRIANCGFSGRRMDCSNHAEHVFFGEFKCQCRYCRRCGADVFSALLGKYVGLWPT